MSSLQLETDLTGWFIEGTFLASVIFALIYIPFFDWRETGTGKAITTLILSIAGALFRPVLILWGVIAVTMKTGQPAFPGFWNDFFAWVSTVSLGAAGVAIITLIFKILQVLFTETGNKWICRLLFIERKPPRGPDGKTR